jgi:hypothetical protein
METDNEKKKREIKNHRKNAKLVLIIGLSVLVISPFILTRPASFNFLDFTNTGEIGDTIGGITAPIVNLIAAILVYLSFQQQILANEIQINLIIHERERDQAKINKEILLLFYSEIKETIFKLEYESVSKIARERGRHGIGSKAMQAYIKDCDSYKEAIRDMTDFHERILSVLRDINEYIDTCRGAKNLTIKEIFFFKKSY